MSVLSATGPGGVASSGARGLTLPNDSAASGQVLVKRCLAGIALRGRCHAKLREHNPDVLIACDEEGGIVTRVEAACGSSYPGNAALGAIDDPGLTRRAGVGIAAMLADGGVNLDLAASHAYLGTRGASRAALVAAASLLAGRS